MAENLSIRVILDPPTFTVNSDEKASSRYKLGGMNRVYWTNEICNFTGGKWITKNPLNKTGRQGLIHVTGLPDGSFAALKSIIEEKPTYLPAGAPDQPEFYLESRRNKWLWDFSIFEVTANPVHLTQAQYDELMDERQLTLTITQAANLIYEVDVGTRINKNADGTDKDGTTQDGVVQTLLASGRV